MALSILNYPDGQAAYTQEYFTIQESSGGIYSDANFKFIAVLKDGSGTQVAKFKFPIYPGQTNKGVVSVSRILEAQVFDFFDNDSTTIATSTLPIFEYEIEFGKEYGTPATEYLNEITTTQYITNAACDKDTDLSGEFLINTTSRNIHTDEISWLYWNNATGSPNAANNVIRFRSYSANGTLLKTYERSFTFTAETQFKIPVGTNTSSLTSGSTFSGGLPAIDAAAAYFTVQYLTEDGFGNYVAVSSLMTYTYYDTCSPHTGYTLLWLNDRGGFDSWYFNMVRRDEYDTERRKMKRHNYEFTGNDYAFNEHKHSRVAFHTSSIRRAELNTGNLSTADFTFLGGLIRSGKVYLHDGSDYYPVLVSDDNYKQLSNLVDGVANLKVNIEFSEPIRT